MSLATMREDFAALHTKTTATIEKATAEKRDLTPEEQTEVDTSFAKLETFKNLETQHAKLAEHAFTTGTAQTAAEPPGRAEQQAAEIVVGNERFNLKDEACRQKFFQSPSNRKMYSEAMTHWARTGEMPDRRFATITTATASGALLPKDVLAPMVPSAPNTFRQALDVWGLSPLKTPTTRDISLPVANPAAGGVVAETASSETENEASLTASILLHAQTFQSGSTWFSNLDLNAVDFDLFSEMLPALNYSKELGLESNYMASIAADSNITQKTATATVTGFTYANLVSLNRALPKRYGFLKVIVLNKAAYIAAENLVTTTGYPILNPDAQNSELKRFNGTPVLWTDYLSGFGANNVVGFTLSNLGFRLRDCDENQVQRYTQTPSRPAQTGFNLYGYHAIGYDPAAMGLLVCPAS